MIIRESSSNPYYNRKNDRKIFQEKPKISTKNNRTANSNNIVSIGFKAGTVMIFFHFFWGLYFLYLKCAGIFNDGWNMKLFDYYHFLTHSAFFLRVYFLRSKIITELCGNPLLKSKKGCWANSAEKHEEKKNHPAYSEIRPCV